MGAGRLTKIVQRIGEHAGPAPSCTICGRPPTGRAVLSMHGEMTCAVHPVSARCATCGRPTDELTADWRGPDRTTIRCPTCATGAIDTAREAKRIMPMIRRDLARMGFELERRVRVKLLTSDELRNLTVEGGPAMFGATTLALWSGGRKEPLDVSILLGLHPVWFGRTVVHENMHAWLAEQGIRVNELAIEEGVCELAAYAWLRDRSEVSAQSIRRLIMTSTDRLYGDGFRAVHAAVQAHGLDDVLVSLRGTGALPPPANRARPKR